MLNEYRRDCDLLLLDIQMPSISGMEVAHRIREIDDKVEIIFVTNLTQYAIEGYEVQAFDYILKPMNYDMFTAKMDRVLRKLNHRSSQKTLDIKSKSGGRRIQVDNILYIESFNHDIMIHTDGEVYKQWGTLSKFEEELKNENFVRCNTSHLVNLKYVQSVTDSQVIVHGTPVPISKPRRKAFLMTLAQYKGGSC